MFFKKQKIKNFNIPTRYWDEEKEIQEERKRRLKMKLGTLKDDQYTVPNLQGAFSRKDNKYRKILEKQRRKSLVRLLIIILAFFILTYLFFGKEFFRQLF